MVTRVRTLAVPHSSRQRFSNLAAVTSACSGASCVVSALSGLREVIVDSQTLLLDAALKAGVRRFIPSDYCIDFTKLPPGTNRNLDWRREFRERVDRAPLSATSILNGAFAEVCQRFRGDLTQFYTILILTCRRTSRCSSASDHRIEQFLRTARRPALVRVRNSCFLAGARSRMERQSCRGDHGVARWSSTNTLDGRFHRPT